MVIPIQGFEDRLFIIQVNQSLHRPGNPLQARAWPSRAPLRQTLRQQLRDNFTQRPPLFLLEAFDLSQQGFWNINGRSGHNNMMLYVIASDVNNLNPHQPSSRELFTKNQKLGTKSLLLSGNLKTPNRKPPQMNQRPQPRPCTFFLLAESSQFHYNSLKYPAGKEPAA
jgi:hypothetical protein